MIQKNYLIALAAVLLLTAIFAFGYRTGGNAVRVEYQQKINEQQAEADQLIQENIRFIQEVVSENEAIKTKIEKERQAHVKTTHDLRTQLSAISLRFQPTGGAGSSDAVPTKDLTASDASAASIELPTSITASLRTIAFECDTLRDDYEALYNFLWDIK